MDDHRIQTPVGGDTENAVAELLEQQRARAEDFFARERQQMHQIEQELLDQVHRLTSQLAQLSDGSELAADLAAIEEELQRRGTSLGSAEEELQQAQDELQQRREELDQRSQQLAQTRQELDQTAHRLAEDAQALQQQQTATGRQRQRIASRLKKRRGQLRQERQRQQQQRAEEQAATEEADQALRAVSDQRDALAEQCDQLRDEVQHLRDQLDAVQQQLAAGPPADPSAAETQQYADDLQVRLDLAMKEIRQLEGRNEDLQQSLEDAQARTSTRQDAPFDWEAQKRRLLEALDGDAGAALEEEEKESLQEQIRQTDDILADKERLIAELQDQLQAQRATAPAPSTEVQEALDSDAAVQEERQKLGDLQEHLREKMREAEVEISLERAKLGRERAELEKKISDLENVIQKRLSAMQTGGRGGGSAKPISRWRAHLGLDGGDD